MAKVVKKNSFLTRFLNSIGAIFVGIALILGCTIGLIWNEANSVKTIKAIDDVQKVVVDVESAKSKSENESKLIAISDDLTFTTPGTDSLYGITAESFVLKRMVEVYEWKETKTGSSTDDEIVYEYDLVWTTSHINSSNFYDKSYSNPAWPTGSFFESDKFFSNDAKLGDFNLSSSQLDKLPASTAVNIPLTVTKPSNEYNITSDYKHLTNAEPTDPQLGDVRISFVQSDVTKASALGKQQGTSIVDYTTKNNVKINRIFSGIMSADEMVNYLTEENTAVTWILRFLFMLLICAGFAMLFTPVEVLVRVIPFIGKFLGKATSTVAKIIGAILGFTLSLLVIAIAWVAVRPAIGIPLLILVIIIIVLLVRRSKKKKAIESNSPTRIES